MTVLIEHDAVCLDHENSPGHPERPARLMAVVRGLKAAELGTALVWVKPRPATIDEVALVHERDYILGLRRLCQGGGGWLTSHTGTNRGSWQAALSAAGAGLDAAERLERSEAEAAFCAVRPPGHHAQPHQAGGFCLFNNIAICAAVLSGRGERVLIVDWDAHHGNGTHDMFYNDKSVLYVSMHQSQLWPGTGAVEETGSGAGLGFTVNFPLPAGATGDVYLAALDALLPMVKAFAPTWVLVSAGFDSHRYDTLEGTALGLDSADFVDLTLRCRAIAPGRVILLLEGGYNLRVLSEASQGCVRALGGQVRSSNRDLRTHGGPGMEVVETVKRMLVS